jgi:hypothetical protein
MKTGLTKILTLSSMALLALASCKKNDALVITNGGTAGTLTASSTTLPLNKALVNDTSTVITFTTTPPKYSFTAAATNTLEIDPAGDNWKSPTLVALGTKVYSQGYSTGAFNAILLKLNLPAGVASQVNVRIQYALSATEFTYSNVVPMTVTPFNLTSWIWVAGDYEGWNNDGGGLDSLVSATGNGVYTGIINIPAGGTLQFKLLPVKGSWTVAYGDAGNGAALATGEAISTSGGNLMAPSPGGQFWITANLNNNVITVVPADYYSLIGSDFTGQSWNVDNYMKFVNDGNNNWVLTIAMIAPSGGGYKIRQDAQWSNSWGSGGANGELTDASGGNLTIASAGTYTSTFTMAPSKYGSPAVTLAPYTITP